MTTYSHALPNQINKKCDVNEVEMNENGMGMRWKKWGQYWRYPSWKGLGRETKEEKKKISFAFFWEIEKEK